MERLAQIQSKYAHPNGLFPPTTFFSEHHVIALSFQRPYIIFD